LYCRIMIASCLAGDHNVGLSRAARAGTRAIAHSGDIARLFARETVAIRIGGGSAFDGSDFRLFTVRGVAEICTTVACCPWRTRLSSTVSRLEISARRDALWLIHYDPSDRATLLLYLPPREWAKHTVILHLFIINAKLNAVDEILCGWRDFEATIG